MFPYITVTQIAIVLFLIMLGFLSKKYGKNNPGKSNILKAILIGLIIAIVVYVIFIFFTLNDMPGIY